MQHNVFTTGYISVFGNNNESVLPKQAKSDGTER